jgi:hypothetical protein
MYPNIKRWTGFPLKLLIHSMWVNEEIVKNGPTVSG